MKINVFVTPKRNVLDPQGAAVGHALESLGFKDLQGTRVGKLIELDVAGADAAAAVEVPVATILSALSPLGAGRFTCATESSPALTRDGAA